MNRVIRGMAGVLVALGASACASDYSLDFGGEPIAVQVSPQVMFVGHLETKELLVRLVNERNQAVPASFTVSEVSTGFTVTPDEDYRPDTVNPDHELESDAEQYQQRFFVTADDNREGSFKVSSGSFSTMVTVRAVPTNLGLLSSTTIATGEPVTLTLPGQMSFTPGGRAPTEISFPGDLDAEILEITDKSVTFLPPPGASGRAKATNLLIDYSPTLKIASLESLDQLARTNDKTSEFSNETPAIGEAVTVTIPTGTLASFTASTTVEFPDGGVALITAQSAKSISFIPIPGSKGIAIFDNIIYDNYPTNGPYELVSPDKIDVEAVTSVPLVYSSTTLGSTETATVTATGFSFDDDVTFNFGAVHGDAFTVSVSPDGSTATILVPTGMSGAMATVSNMHLNSLPAVNLANIPSSVAITSGSGYATLPGTGTSVYDGGGQPTFAVPAPGMGMFIADNPSFGDASWDGAAHPSSWYRLTVTGTGSRDMVMDWNSAADIDFFVVNSDGTALVVSRPTGAHPEVGSGTLTDGLVYYVIAELWSGTPPTELLVTIK